MSELPRQVGLHRRWSVIVGATALVLVTAPVGAQTVASTAPTTAATEDAAAVRSVEQLLATLDADAHDRRVLELAVGLGGGALAVGLGAWFLADNESVRAMDNPGYYIVIAGAGLMAGGVLAAVLPSHADALRYSWQETAHLPLATRRVAFERTLDEVAQGARTRRRFAGGFLIAGGAVAVVTAGLIYGAGRESGAPGAGEFALGVGGVGLVALGIPALSMRSPAENAAMFWRAGTSRPPPRLAGVSVLPMRGGVLASVGLVF